MRTAGFVLAGGASRRMGRDKARLPLASESLIESIARKVKTAAGSVCLVGAAERYADLPFESINDLRPGGGPLAGIEAVLSRSAAEWNLIVACDMPDVTSEWLEHLLAEAQQSNEVCLVSQDPDGKVHPLCAVWHRDALPYVQRALDHNRLRLLDLVEELHAAKVAAPHPLANLNTPEEWQSWQLTR